MATLDEIYKKLGLLDGISADVKSLNELVKGNGKVGLCEKQRITETKLDELRADLSAGDAATRTMALKAQEMATQALTAAKAAPASAASAAAAGSQTQVVVNTGDPDIVVKIGLIKTIVSFVIKNWHYISLAGLAIWKAVDFIFPFKKG